MTGREESGQAPRVGDISGQRLVPRGPPTYWPGRSLSSFGDVWNLGAGGEPARVSAGATSIGEVITEVGGGSGGVVVAADLQVGAGEGGDLVDAGTGAGGGEEHLGAPVVFVEGFDANDKKD